MRGVVSPSLLPAVHSDELSTSLPESPQHRRRAPPQQRPIHEPPSRPAPARVFYLSEQGVRASPPRRRLADHPSITPLQSLSFPSVLFRFGVLSLPRGLIVGSASLQSPHAPP